MCAQLADEGLDNEIAARFTKAGSKRDGAYGRYGVVRDIGCL